MPVSIDAGLSRLHSGIFLRDLRHDYLDFGRERKRHDYFFHSQFDILEERKEASMTSHRFLKFLALFLLLNQLAFAQTSDAPDETVDVDTIETEIGKKPSAANTSPSANAKTPESLKEPEKLSDLSRLAPFSEVSVLQRRFLPKTERFQMYLGLATIANDPWFWGIGGGGRFGYNFSEQWAVELNFSFLSNSEKDAVRDLRTNNSVNTNSIVSAQSYLGLDAVWTPVYGKMSLFNRRIVPFDMYFTVGVGQSGITNATTTTAPAFHFGGGQIFAMSKSVGFRWDLSWNFYNATPNPGASTTNLSSTQFNNLLLTLGASFFFPEAKYR